MTTLPPEIPRCWDWGLQIDHVQQFSSEESKDFYCLHQSLEENFFLTPNLVCSVTHHASKPNDFFNHLSPSTFVAEHSLLTNFIVHDLLYEKACHLSVNFFFSLVKWHLSRLLSLRERPCRYFITGICHLLDMKMLIYTPFLHMIYKHFSWMP